ncbi:MAG TPA: hypothetical protein PKI01_08475 [Bacteroidales bacterium]|nr:hypothetical protein [Bacteroidales bacterium]
MAGAFSFSLSDIEHIISNTNNMVLGISKVMAVYFSEKKNQPEAIVATDPYTPEEFNEYIIDNNTLVQIEKLRSLDATFDWYAPEDIPFFAETKKIKQLDVFDENNRHILMITLKNEHDNKNDLIFYYFNKNLSNFAPSESENYLSPANKIAIGSMLYKFANLMAEICRNDRQALKSYNNNIRNIVNSLKKSVTENEEHHTNYYNALINFVNDALQEISAKSSRYVFELSDSARLKLKDYQGEFKALNKIIKTAAVFAGNMNEGLAGNTVMIEDYHIDFGDSPPAEIQPSVRMDESKYDKTILLLDRIEEASKIVKQKKLPLTGANVGKACKPPVSAPAISDALNKHRARIKTVMSKYKDRWTTIRNDFKPLINVLTSRSSDDETLSKQA